MENQHNKDCEEALLALRQDIDQIDEQILSLLIARMQIVAKVGKLKENYQETFFIRSNREADMIRDLIKKAQNKLPKATILGIWRKIITTANMDEQPIHMLVHNPNKTADYELLLKDYYNATVPISNFDDATEVFELISQDNYKIGVFSLPKFTQDNNLEQNWWLNMAKNYPNLNIFAKIPFFTQSQDNKNQLELVVIAQKKPEQSSDDNSLVYLKKTAEQRSADIIVKLAKNNLTAKLLKIAGDDMLLEVKGFICNGDVRLNNMTNVKILGHYPVPIML